MKPREKFCLCPASLPEPGWATSSSGKDKSITMNGYIGCNCASCSHTQTSFSSDPNQKLSKTERRNGWKETRQNTIWTKWKAPLCSPRVSTKWSESYIGELACVSLNVMTGDKIRRTKPYMTSPISSNDNKSLTYRPTDKTQILDCPTH